MSPLPPMLVIGAISAATMTARVTLAQPAEQTIVSLPFTSGFTAGPRVQDYPPAQDSMDLWAVEDFTTTQPWLIGDFSCFGNGFGTPTDVVAHILDGLPPGGHV